MAQRLKMAAAAALAVIATATTASAADLFTVETLPAGTSSWSPAGRFPDAVRVGDQCRFTDACNGGRTVTRAGWSWYTDRCGNRSRIKPNCGGGRERGRARPRGCPTVCRGATAWRVLCATASRATAARTRSAPAAPSSRSRRGGCWASPRGPPTRRPPRAPAKQCRLADTCRAGAAVTLTRGEPYVDGWGNTLVAAGCGRVDATAGTGAIGPGCLTVWQGDPAAAVTVRQVREVYECPDSGALMVVYLGCHARFLTTLN